MDERRTVLRWIGGGVVVVAAPFLVPFLEAGINGTQVYLWPNPLFLVPLGAAVVGILAIAFSFLPRRAQRDQASDMNVLIRKAARKAKKTREDIAIPQPDSTPEKRTDIKMRHPDLPGRTIVARTEAQAEVHQRSGWFEKPGLLTLEGGDGPEFDKPVNLQWAWNRIPRNPGEYPIRALAKLIKVTNDSQEVIQGVRVHVTASSVSSLSTPHELMWSHADTAVTDLSPGASAYAVLGISAELGLSISGGNKMDWVSNFGLVGLAADAAFSLATWAPGDLVGDRCTVRLQAPHLALEGYEPKHAHLPRLSYVEDAP